MRITNPIKHFLVLLICVGLMGAGKAEKRVIAVELTVPDAAWTIVIDAVYRVGDELWVISTLSRDPNVMAAQVITTVQDSLALSVPDLPLKHFVIGKTWRWQNEETHTFIQDLKQIEDRLRSAALLYKNATK